MAADDAAKAAIDELYKSLTIDRIIGAPIEIGDKIILPITRMGIVFGTGLHYGVRTIVPKAEQAEAAAFFL